MPRSATIHRKTNETDIRLKLNLDGRGKVSCHYGHSLFRSHARSRRAPRGFRFGDYRERRSRRRSAPHRRRRGHRSRRSRPESSRLKARHSARGIFFDADGRNACRRGRRSRRTALLRSQRENLGKTRRRFPNGARPKIFSRDSRKPRAPTFTCARFTAARRIIKSKPCSKRSRARCVSPSRAISVFAAFCPARKGFYERHAPRLRRGQRHERRAGPATSRRGMSQRSNSPECIAKAEAHHSSGRRPLRRADPRARRAKLSARRSLDALHRGVPFLGVCLGLQALYKSSEEAPELQGLHLLPGSVCSLPASVKLPHMGWNQLSSHAPSRLLEGISADAYFYFAHSFAATDSNGEAVRDLQPRRGISPPSSKSKISYAVQFHPEKSGDAGAQLLQNFLRLAA